MDEEEFREIVVDFVPQLKNKLDQMKTAVDQADFKELAGLAHWLKGAGGTVGFQEFFDPSVKLETAARGCNLVTSKIWLAELMNLSERVSVEAPSS
jgi:HPt (histidine-containing phosphotransfer) domain-containing protein